MRPMSVRARAILTEETSLSRSHGLKCIPLNFSCMRSMFNLELSASVYVSSDRKKGLMLSERFLDLDS